MKRFYLWCGSIAAALFLIALFYALRMSWVKSADFDVTGILWLMQNVAQLFAIVMTVLLGALMLFCFLSAYRMRHSGHSDEATEARFRARFGAPRQS